MRINSIVSLLIIFCCCRIGLFGQGKYTTKAEGKHISVSVSNCLIDAELKVISTSLGSPLEGPFAPGEIVTFQFDILNYRADPTNSGNQCQWLQGVIPVFGNGWDPLSFNSSGRPGNSFAPSDIWEWFEEGEVGYNSTTNEYTLYQDTTYDRIAICNEINPNCPDTGITNIESPLPGGWFITTKDSRAPCPQPGIDPDDSWGIPQECGSNQDHGSFTFSLTVRNYSDKLYGCSATGFVDTWVEIYTFTDGEIGCFLGENTLCTQDSAYRFSTYNICVPSNSTVRYFNQRDPLCSASGINSYQAQMSSLPNYPNQRWPGCNNSDSLIRPHWISFVANTEQMDIVMDIVNCENNQGVKWALYELPCRFYIGRQNQQINTSQLGPPITSCDNVQNPQSGQQNIEFTALTGQVYAILIDGWEGDLCEINLEQNNAGTLPDLSENTLEQPTFNSVEYGFDEDTVCIGAENVAFTVPQIEGACRYSWRLRIGDSIVQTLEYGPNITLDFPERNSFTLCVFASNFCTSTAQSCIDIEVAPSKESYLVADTVCEGDRYIWRDQEGEVIENFPPQNTPGLQQLTMYLDEADGCSVTANLDLFVRPENEDNPTLVDTFVCFPEIQAQDFVFYCDTLKMPGLYQDQHCISSNTGCDTFFTVEFNVLGGKLGYESSCDGEGNMIFEFKDPENGNYTPWDQQIEKFENEPDFTINWQWSTAQGAISLDSSRELKISQDDIKLYEEQDTFYLSLSARIEYKGDQLCVSDSTFKFSLEDHFPQINRIFGDRSYCLGQEGLEFWANVSDPDTPQHNHPNDKVFLNLWNLPSGFSHIPPSNPSRDTINIVAPQLSSGNQLCLEVVTDQCAFRDQVCLTLKRRETPVSIKALDSCRQNIFTIEGFEGNILDYSWTIDQGTIISSGQSALVVIEPSISDTSVLNVEVLGDCIGVGAYSIPPTGEPTVITDLSDESRDVYVRDCFRGSLIVVTEPACSYRWGYINMLTQNYQFPILALDSTVWTGAYIEVSDTVSSFRQYFVERVMDCSPTNCESELILIREADKVNCKDPHFGLFPNPNAGNFTVDIHNYSEGQYSLQIVNSVGQKVHEMSFDITDNKVQVPIYLPNTGQGFHTALLIQNEMIKDTQNFIITK